MYSYNRPHRSDRERRRITDYGAEPFVVNIRREALQNRFFRRALWTGEYLQLTLMSIPCRGEIGQEMHSDTDQFLRIEEGQGVVMMGKHRGQMNHKRRVGAGDAIFVPAGTWHNLVNVAHSPLKLYSIYAPPHHPHGTIHQTKDIADKAGD